MLASPRANATVLAADSPPPAGLTSIGDGAFRGCSALARVTVPTTTTVGNNAFPSTDAVLRLPPAKHALIRLGSYGPDGAARQRDREEFEGDFADPTLHAD
ncbi:hypothetical protein EMIHUDRAFT_225242 [Emiliania huxleyi CCMP1516]|uniref:Leucine-rich repeat domain-containing protein n=2 Tax=Emiliania huxleyi TaxID=2903 RepID=A0A0D3KPH7_EMIH1|nr:hypothetical protein EMIHUDRAFT_225242 [Emiliania huxleyi CCMP1516]EOD37662.1 hypothetical protein EMIHUDRAFT_225242 [Emiliania huxleyi CCMP1516]|eukprot:XP_005790091.1 hypothetical protein EMIHUDRAFT_225242 [Emiliania huxleyi CCMP1516]